MHFNLQFIIYGSLNYYDYSEIGDKYPLQQIGYDPDRVDATILFFPYPHLIEHFADLHKRGHPCALAFRNSKDIPYVTGDDESCVGAVVCRLHRHGHRRIAFAAGSPQNASAVRRMEGYRRGLAKAGLPFDPALVFGEGFDNEGTFLALHDLLTRGIRFTALVASSDMGAYGSLRALRSHHIAVPSQVEVVGYDNRFDSALCDPPLSTFEIPLEEVAYTAAAFVARQLQGEVVPQVTKIKPLFINRASTLFTDFDPYLDHIPPRQTSAAQLPPALRSLLELIPVAGDMEEILAAAEKVMTEAVRNELDLAPLAQAIGERIQEMPSGPGPINQRKVVAAALRFALTTERLTCSQASNYSERFSAMTNHLRNLSLSDSSEEKIADVLRLNLGALGFQRAGLYLRSPTQEGSGGHAGVLHHWDLQNVLHRKQDADTPDVLTAALDLADHYPVVFILPLTVNAVVVGSFITHTHNRYRVELGELFRQINGTLGSLALSRDLARSNEKRHQSEYLYSSLVESLPQIIVRKDAAGRFTYANPNFATLVDRPLELILGRTDDDLYPAELASKLHADDQRVMATGESLTYERVTERHGARQHLQIKKTPLFDHTGACVGVQVVFWDVTPFRETEGRLRETQRELIEVSRRAGIAEIATGVLHNIGNALNSVNVSAGVISDYVRRLKIDSVGKLEQLLVRDTEPWSATFANHPRGQQVVGFVHVLEEQLKSGRARILAEIEAMRNGVEHINHIVAAQQEFAQASGLTEVQDPAETMEYALRLYDAELLRHDITVTRDYRPTPPIRLERHKAVQVLLNLLRNAKESLTHCVRVDKHIRISVLSPAPDEVRFCVTDNGGGIAPEDLPRLFAMGFTTKKGGRGFGLHNSALTAASLGGSLRAESHGPGAGATFLFTLPADRGDAAETA